MGYDMYWHKSPGKGSPEQAAYDAAREAAFAYCRVVDGGKVGSRQRTTTEQAKVERLFEAMYEREFWYYRLNIWGMQEARQQLAPLGIICTEYDASWTSNGWSGRTGECPQAEQFGLTDEDDCPTPNDDGIWTAYRQGPDGKWDDMVVTPTPQQIAYHEAIEAYLRRVPDGDIHGVMIHKLSDNSGWWVTPGEIVTGISWANKHHEGWESTVDDYVRDFVFWMSRAASEGQGFRVH